MVDRNNGRPDRSADPDSGDRTGCGNPPEKSRFKPGRSGNPKSRPKGARGWKKTLEKVAGETRTVTEGGRQQRSKLDLVVLTLCKMAAQGDVAAIRELHRLSAVHGPQEPPAGYGYLVMPPPMTEEEWIKKYCPRADDSAPDPKTGTNDPP